MSGVSVQVGPRSPGRRCASWGRVIARERAMTLLVAGLVAFEFVLVITMIMLGHAHRDPVPAVFTPPPSAFCPAGQHVTGVSASGWPDCAANR